MGDAPGCVAVGPASKVVAVGPALESVALGLALEVVAMGCDHASLGLAQVARFDDCLPWYLYRQPMD